jgi:hypothetical protein
LNQADPAADPASYPSAHIPVLSFAKINHSVSTMAPGERLDRLERVAKLLVTSGRRTRNELRTNINALIDAQMRNEIRFSEQFENLSAVQSQTDLQIKDLIVAQRRTEKKVEELAASHKELAASQRELVVSQKHTDEKLSTLIDIVERERNGKR